MRVVVLALMTISLTGCGEDSVMGNLGLGSFGEEGDIQDAVRASLKDPESARFGELTVVGKQACQTVNAKNSMGGYTGNQQAYLMKDGNEWGVLEINSKLTHEACLQVIAGVNY